MPMSVIDTESSGDEHREQVSPVAFVDPSGAAPCSCELTCESSPGGDVVVLRVAGEIDMLTLPVLRDALTSAVDQRPRDLVVDLAAVGFCCVRGFALLEEAARTARACGVGIALSGLNPRLKRVAALLGLRPCCVRSRSAVDAVTAIHVDDTRRLRSG